MMWKRNVIKLVLFLAVFLAAAAGTFYIEKRMGTNLKEDRENVQGRKEKAVKTASADIPIIKIGDETVYYPEFEFYLLASKKDYESLLGEGVWKAARNGRSLEELLKTDIIEEIAHLKIVINEAKKEGYSLTEAEAEEIKKTAKAQLKGIDPLIKARYYLDDELIAGIYMENYLATKFFNSYSKKAGLEGEKAKELFNLAYSIWESRYIAEIYWENINSIDIGAFSAGNH